MVCYDNWIFYKNKILAASMRRTGTFLGRNRPWFIQ